MDVGKTIKSVRLKKNIKAVDLYKSILTKPAYVKFEAGKNDTTVSKFLLILDRLNISLEEFEVLHKQKSNRHFYYVNHYMNYFYQRNITGLESLAIEAEDEYLVTQIEKYKHYNALILLLIDYLTDSTDHKNCVEILQQYLSTCENWGYYEITLFTNSLIHFSNDFIDVVYSRVKKNFMIHTEQLIRYRHEMAIILFNIIEKKILEQDSAKLKYYLTELLVLKENTLDNMYVQTTIKYFSCIITAITNNLFNRQTDENIAKIIDFLDFIELHTKSSQSKEFYNKVKKIYTN